MNLRGTLIVIVLIVHHIVAYSQMQMGIAHDNINVLDGIRINPALAVDPLPYLDIRAAGMYFFGTSNGAYLASEDFSPFTGKFPSEVSQNMSIEKVNGQVDFVILGPALNAAIGKYSVGFSTSFRNYASGVNLPKEFTRGLIDGFRIPDYYGQRLEGSNYRTKAVSFIEFGLNGGMIVHQKGSTVVNFGVNLKYLLGIGGLDFLVDDFQYQMHDSINADVYNFTGKYGGSDIGFHPGVGYGADLGITIEKKVAPARYYEPHSPKSNCKYLDYVYRFGFSVLDIGAIKFKGSSYREAVNSNGEWDNYAETRTKDIGEVLDQLDKALGSGVNDSKSTYYAKLPMSFSMQFDYNFGKGVFLNTTLVYAAPLKNSFGGERISMLAITPRYEGKRFGLSAPVSINTTWKPGIGLAVRFWYLTIGTDNVIPWVANIDVYRLDIYAHIKIPVFVNTKCRKRGLGEYDWHFSDCSAPGMKRTRKPKKFK